MKKLVLAALAGAACFGLSVAPVSAAKPEVTLRLHTFLPPVANPVKHFMVPWAKKIEKDSNGRIKVKIYPSMQHRVDAAGFHPGRDAHARDLRTALPA